MSQWVEAAGIRWHIQRAGYGPPLLLVHGTGASTHSWRDLLPILAQEYAVLAVDLPGHGFTDPVSAARSSITGMSESILTLLRTMCVDPRFCVGHSAGAVILCRMALDRHIAPRTIVSINGAFIPLSGGAKLAFPLIARFLAGSAFASRQIARRAGNRANIERIIAATGSSLDAAGIEFYVRLMSNPKHVAGALSMMSHWDLHAFARELSRLTTPLALMVGENDLTVPPQQAVEVGRRMPHAAVYRLPGLGHLAHEEQPSLVAREILRICRAS
jgi:magnesium chelatase accessory protein